MSVETTPPTDPSRPINISAQSIHLSDHYWYWVHILREVICFEATRLVFSRIDESIASCVPQRRRNLCLNVGATLNNHEILCNLQCHYSHSARESGHIRLIMRTNGLIDATSVVCCETFGVRRLIFCVSSRPRRAALRECNFSQGEDLIQKTLLFGCKI
jgi:hypothetical protein